MINCKHCGEEDSIGKYTKGYCRKCYSNYNRKGTPARVNKVRSSIEKCEICGNVDSTYVSGLCRTCYRKRTYQKEVIKNFKENEKNKLSKLCKLCKIEKEFYKSNVCKECYDNFKKLEVSLFLAGFLIGDYSQKG